MKYFLDRAATRDLIAEFVKKYRSQNSNTVTFIAKIGFVYLLIFLQIGIISYLCKHLSLSGFLSAIPLFIILLGCLHYIIAQGAHEAVHFHIHHDRNKIYSAITAFLVLYPIGITRHYKKNHMQHHIYFGDKNKDPDYVTFMNYPVSKIHFWWWIAESLFGLSTLKRILNLFSSTKPAGVKTLEEKTNLELLNLVFVQSFIFAAFCMLKMWWGYFIFWILPLAVVAKTLINIRLLAEHTPFYDNQPHKKSPLPLPTSKILAPGLICGTILRILKYVCTLRSKS